MSLRLALASTPAWKIGLIPVLSVVLLKVLGQTPAGGPAPEVEAKAEVEVPSVAPAIRPVATLPELSLNDALAFDPFNRLALPPRIVEEPPVTMPEPVVGPKPAVDGARPLVDRAASLKELKVSAVFPSAKGSVAIIDSKTVRAGDLLSPGVRVVEIRGMNVILRVEEGEAAPPDASAETAIR